MPGFLKPYGKGHVGWKTEIRAKDARPCHAGKLTFFQLHGEFQLKPCQPGRTSLLSRDGAGGNQRVPCHVNQRLVQGKQCPLVTEGSQKPGGCFFCHGSEESGGRKAEGRVQESRCFRGFCVAQGRTFVEAETARGIKTFCRHGRYGIHRIIRCWGKTGQCALPVTIGVTGVEGIQQMHVPVPCEAHSRMGQQNVTFPLPKSRKAAPRIICRRKKEDTAQCSHGGQVFLLRLLLKDNAVADSLGRKGVILGGSQGRCSIRITVGRDKHQDPFHADLLSHSFGLSTPHSA